MLPQRWKTGCVSGFRRVLLLVWALLWFGGLPGQAQELRHKEHPLSVYLDLRPTVAGSPAQNTPAWVEALEFTAGSKRTADEIEQAIDPEFDQDRARGVYRIRLHHPPGNASEQLQARFFFQDSTDGARPEVSLFNELGEQTTTPYFLGQNLGLPSSETLTLPMHGVDYLEVKTNQDGSQVRGVFLSWLESTEVLQPTDFLSKEKARQPFEILAATRRKRNAAYLYGVVTASLQTGLPIVLRPSELASTDFQFNLERQPLLAVITYEVLGVAIDAPPAVTINGQLQGNSQLFLPDLADPGYQGQARETETKLAFRYTGWLRAQKTVPGDCLIAGLNNLALSLSNGTDAVAVRHVSIQLKYDWEKLDYVLAPATSTSPATHETP